MNCKCHPQCGFHWRTDKPSIFATPRAIADANISKAASAVQSAKNGVKTMPARKK